MLQMHNCASPRCDFGRNTLRLIGVYKSAVFCSVVIRFNMKITTNLTSKEHMHFDVAVVAGSKAVNGDTKISCIKKLDTNKLFARDKEVMIEHQNEIYFLRITKQNKLILTK
jgi:hemin uptake protein HemP